MIKSLKIKNIQSHRDSVLNFSDNVNIIIGSSNNGKSAILRALLWVIYNRPLGVDNLANHDIYDDRNNLIDIMSVVIENDNHTVERRRSNSVNQYIVDGSVLNAVRADVPDDVSKCLRLSETNIQKQLDSPFLISKSDYEIAKYFNSIINIDIIDKILNKAESIKRGIKSDINSDNEEIKKIEISLNKYKFLDDVEVLVDKYDEYSSKADGMRHDIDELDNQIKLSKELSNNSVKINNIIKVFKDIDVFYTQIKELDYDINVLKDSISIVCKKFDISIQVNLLNSINNHESYESEIKELEEDIDSFNQFTSSVIKNNELIKDYKKQLPSTCPYCGSLLSKECD